MRDITPLPASLRLLVLGGGAVAREYHLPAIHRMGLAAGAMVVDASPANAARLQETWPALGVRQADFRSVLAEPDLAARFDAALVTLPTGFHEEAVLRALEAGLHVLCEKPLTLTADACLRLARASEDRNLTLAVGMVRRLLPSVAAVRKALTEGLIGDLVSVNIECGGAFAWPSDSGFYFRPEHGGLLANVGVHYLDFAEDLFGPLEPMELWHDGKGGAEANVEYTLRTARGIPVRIGLSYTHELRNAAVITGTAGELVLDNDDAAECEWRLVRSGLTGKLRATNAFRSGRWRPTLESCFIEQLWEFVEAVRGRRSPRVGARAAAETMRLVDDAPRHRVPRDRGITGATIRTDASRPALDPSPVVVTGGTGFVGARLIERLTDLGFTGIAVPVRSYMTGAEAGRFPVRLRQTNLLDDTAVREAVRGARYVFHLAYGSGGDDAGKVTVDGTANVVRAAVAAGAEAVVVLSTAAVFGNPDGIVDERSPYVASLGEYGRSKTAAEKKCLALARESSSTRIVVLNPASVYGPGGKTFSILPARMAAAGSFCWIEDGRGLANYVYVDNLVDAILLSAVNPKAHGQRFIVCDGACTWRELLSPVVAPWQAAIRSFTLDELRRANEGHRSPGMRQIVKALLVNNAEFWAAVSANKRTAAVKRVAAAAFPRVQSRIQRARRSSAPNPFDLPQTDEQVPPLWLAELFGVYTTRLSSEKARTELGWTPRVPLGEGQQRTIEWLQFARFYPEAADGDAGQRLMPASIS